MSLFPLIVGRNDIVHHPREPMTHFPMNQKVKSLIELLPYNTSTMQPLCTGYRYHSIIWSVREGTSDLQASGILGLASRFVQPEAIVITGPF